MPCSWVTASVFNVCRDANRGVRLLVYPHFTDLDIDQGAVGCHKPEKAEFSVVINPNYHFHTVVKRHWVILLYVNILPISTVEGTLQFPATQCAVVE